MEEDDAPTFTIKKRSKPRSSAASIRSSTAAPAASTDQPAGAQPAQDDDEDAGNVAVFRSRGKKTPAGRVKDREAPKARSRVSFGADDDVSLRPVSRL